MGLLRRWKTRDATEHERNEYHRRDRREDRGVRKGVGERREHQGYAGGADAEEGADEGQRRGAQFGAADIRDERVDGAVQHAAAEADEEDRAGEEPDRWGEGNGFEPDDDRDEREDQEVLVAAPVDDRPENERAAENPETQYRQQRARLGLADGETGHHRRERCAERRQHDPERR